ncbi:MAG: S4 domain-containing protein [Methylococcales bacterium]|jgi:ribosome-associated heat shock protein Hsp15|nr:S4 domain-containing protein [Methylococcales bacterium]
MSELLDSIRIDKWLWTARFFKTRSLAAQAVSGGKVHVNKQRVKSSKEVKIGAILAIHKEGFEWEITVTGIVKQRVSAKEVAALYEESQGSLVKRLSQIDIKREERQLLGFVRTENKPNKKDRRLIHHFKRAE